MGQYFLIVNPVKRQFLNPHKFGCGLKLMEFTNSEFGPQQALCVLLAHANGRGGGDLGTEDLTDDEKALIGSWAGDPISVAGDYDDAWLGVPEDLKGKEYTTQERRMVDVPGQPGWKREGKAFDTVHHVFGKRKNRETGEVEDHDENLYSAASAFFEDISDKVITLVVKGEAGYHPWAAMDLSDDGWRSVPQWGILPETEPKKPAAGKRVYNAYKKIAKSQAAFIADQVEFLLRKHPEQAGAILAAVREKVKAASSAVQISTARKVQ